MKYLLEKGDSFWDDFQWILYSEYDILDDNELDGLHEDVLLLTLNSTLLSNSFKGINLHKFKYNSRFDIEGVVRPCFFDRIEASDFCKLNSMEDLYSYLEKNKEEYWYDFAYEDVLKYLKFLDQKYLLLQNGGWLLDMDILIKEKLTLESDIYSYYFLIIDIDTVKHKIKIIDIGCD